MSDAYVLYRVRLLVDDGVLGYCVSDREARLFVRRHLKEERRRYGCSIDKMIVVDEFPEDENAPLVDVDTGEIIPMSDFGFLIP